jgi:hypothetical protein
MATPPTPPPTPDTPTWDTGADFSQFKSSGTGVRQIPRPSSPLLSWYGNGNLPPGCVISGGVVTSYHTCG